MSFILENISNFNLISVLKIKWNSVDKEVFPRPYHALSFRTNGDSIFTVNEKTKKRVVTGDTLFVPKDLGYGLTANAESLFCVHFIADNLPTDTIYFYSPSDIKLFEKLFSDMYDTWSEKKPGYQNKTASYFFKILSKLQLEENEFSYRSNHTAILNTIDYIHEHFTDPALTIQHLSQISSISESFFRKEFKVITGVSPLQYINNLRITYALELLEFGYYKIYEIAQKAGFTDSKYFSTVIKKATGLTPKELYNRNRFNNSNG